MRSTGSVLNLPFPVPEDDDNTVAEWDIALSRTMMVF